MITYIAVFVLAILLLIIFPRLLYRNIAPLFAVAIAFAIFNQSQIVELFVVLGEQISGEPDISLLGFSLFPKLLFRELAATVLAGTSIYFWARLASWSWLTEFRSQTDLPRWKKLFAWWVQAIFPFLLLGVYFWIVGTQFIAIRSGLWIAFFACAAVMILVDFLLATELEDGMVRGLAAESGGWVWGRAKESFAGMSQPGQTDQAAFGLFILWAAIFVAVAPLIIAAVFFSLLALPLRWLVAGDQEVGDAGHESSLIPSLPVQTKKKVREDVVENVGAPFAPKPFTTPTSIFAPSPLGPKGYKNLAGTPVVGVGTYNTGLANPTGGIVAPFATAFLSIFAVWWPVLFATGAKIIGIVILVALLLMLPALQMLLFFGLVIALVIWPSISSSIGTIVLVNLFVASSLSLFFLLMRLDPKGRLIAVPLAIALGLSFLDLNDNHGIRTIDKPVTPLVGAETAFENWLTDRFKPNESATVPVYVVAAPGGGIYAAHHAALMLSQLEDEIPGFSRHLFAISGVSGGSVGAALYAGLVRENENIPLPDGFEEASAQFLIHDFLTTTTSMTLFNDSLARVVPSPFARPWDRALAIEQDFANAWSEMRAGRNWFDASFYEHWQSDGNTPALLLNTTAVGNGERVVISPFRIDSIDRVATTLFESSNSNLRMSTAVGLSARFPGLSPAGSYVEKRSGAKRRLVDGGYADNSGVATALDLMRQLRSAQSEQNYHVVLLVLRFKAYAANPSQGFGELFSPLRTLNSTRAARSLEWIDIAKRELGDTDSIRELWLDTGEALPLGWRLSTSSQDAIRTSLKTKNESEVAKISAEIRRTIESSRE